MIRLLRLLLIIRRALAQGVSDHSFVFLINLLHEKTLSNNRFLHCFWNSCIFAMILTMAQQILQLLLFFTICVAAVVQLFNTFFTRGAALREAVARAER